MNKRALVRVRGVVQGVGFRHYTAKTAGQHQVNGWVRNLFDGSVEACFEGEAEKVDAMVQWCHQGPRNAVVEKVTVEEQPYRGECSGFSIRYDHD